MKRLVMGCGYLGQRVADHWRAAGDEVHVMTRSRERARQLATAGFAPLVGDVTEPRSLPSLPATDTVLWAVGFDRSSGRSQRDVYVQGWDNLLVRLPPETGRIIYVSSTGVYGQQDGSWVDEQSDCRPQRPGGQACLDAEQLLLASRWSSRAIILRLAGIYGPQRIPRLAQVLAGVALPSDPQATINLIHVDDAASAVAAAALWAGVPPALFLIADDQPVLRQSFYQELARLYEAPPPVFTPPPDGARGRASSHKRVANGRMKDELGVVLRFASYREGLAAIRGGERASCDRGGSALQSQADET